MGTYPNPEPWELGRAGTHVTFERRPNLLPASTCAALDNNDGINSTALLCALRVQYRVSSYFTLLLDCLT